MTLISPVDCTLQCGMWLWNRDSEFTKWQHPAMWYVTLGWHAMQFTQTSAILEFYIWSGFHFHTSPQSTCHSVPVCLIVSKSDHPQQKRMMSCRFSTWRISAILILGGSIMGSLKSPCVTSYKSSIDIMAVNCLVFEKITFFAFWRQTDRQKDEQMDNIDALSCSRWRERLSNKPFFLMHPNDITFQQFTHCGRALQAAYF